MSEFTYEIKEEIAVLSKNSKGWRRELNLISWNGNAPKYDIRDWAPDHEKMGKGLTLTKEEAKALASALCEAVEDKDRDEKVYRRRDRMYRLEDARRQIADYLDVAEDELCVPDGMDLEVLVERFEETQDCNVPENDTWQNVIGEYMEELWKEEVKNG